MVLQTWYDAIFNLQYAIQNMKYAICNIQYAIWNMQCAIFNMQYTICCSHNVIFNKNNSHFQKAYQMEIIANWILHHIMFVTPFKAFNICQNSLSTHQDWHV